MAELDLKGGFQNEFWGLMKITYYELLFFFFLNFVLSCDFLYMIQIPSKD